MYLGKDGIFGVCEGLLFCPGGHNICVCVCMLPILRIVTSMSI